MIETLPNLLDLMKSYGATRFYAKKLAPNDNSKNQVYLGGNFSALNIIPYHGIRTDDSRLQGSVRDRAKADISFSWVDAHGRYPAPHAQLILYPKYPEVRMSGFLRGAENAPSGIMNVRQEGRVLFLGITPDGQLLGYAAGPHSPLARELEAQAGLNEIGVFLEIPHGSGLPDTRQQLLDKLATICRKHWIPSKKLGPDGQPNPYLARNGGGYTLEAELGIMPNGYAEPDYLGWEIKQYAVTDHETCRPKGVITLMTPEPTDGFYKRHGIESFLRRFGYPDKNGKADRMNFGGIYTCMKDFHADTGLKLALQGYDASTGKITDMTGGIILLSRQNEIAAKWDFSRLMEHWTRKHAHAAYIPSLFRTPPPQYAYCPRILLCEQTDFTLFLKAVANSSVRYDPAIKMEPSVTGNPETKRRSQFRTRFSDLANLYYRHEYVELQIE